MIHKHRRLGSRALVLVVVVVIIVVLALMASLVAAAAAIAVALALYFLLALSEYCATDTLKLEYAHTAPQYILYSNNRNGPSKQVALGLGHYYVLGMSTPSQPATWHCNM